MSTITLAGDYTSALTHFAQYGLASLAEQHHPQGVTLGWSREAVPKAQLTVEGADAHTLAGYLHELAKQLSKMESWVQICNTYGAKSVSPFSPRVSKMSSPSDWKRHQKIRQDMIDKLTQEKDYLSLCWISSLGEASYWFSEKTRKDKKNYQDSGASRWEMADRGSGREFVHYRLRRMCEEVATWPIEMITNGIIGIEVNDTIGKNAPDSWTATGFTTPRPTDVSLVLSAMIGMSWFPVVHNVNGLSVTPGAWPSNDVAPENLVLPLSIENIKPARLRTVLRSRVFAAIINHVCYEESETGVSGDKETFKAYGSREQLKAHGMEAVVRFPVKTVRTKSNAYRFIQEGEPVLL